MEPTARELFFSKHDAQDPRLGDLAHPAHLDELKNPSLVLWGVPDDEGIRLNGGRPGAALAPQEIRRFLYRMTPPARGGFRQQIFDLGNLPQQGSLPERHERARALAESIHRAGHFAVSFGGGHDYGFSDTAGFLQVYKGQNPLVINFDAHLDVRPTDLSFHSGTPFRRVLEAFKDEFEFWEIGLQPQCNSRHHADWAESQGAHLLFLDEALKALPEDVLPTADSRRPCFISLDIDVFSSKEAPGCSQSWATGFTIENFLPWLEFVLKSYKVCGLGFYEVSPPLDTDNRTSKLAALILYQALRLGSFRGLG